MSTAPATLPADFNGWDQPKSSPPDTLPANFDKWDAQAQEAPQRSWLDSVSDFAGEMWKQVNPVTAVQGLSQAAAHPIQAGKELMQGQAAIEQKAEAAFKKGDYVEGVRHVLNYLIPVLGQQTDAAGDLMQSGQIAKGAGMTAGIAANIAGPEALKGVTLKNPIGELPQRLYQSALKPSTALTRAETKSLVNTGLDNGIPVSAEGAAKIDQAISDLNSAVKGKIAGGAQAGATIDRNAVASRLKQTAQQFGTQVTPQADLQAVGKVGTEFMQSQPAQIPVDQAQALKQGTYRQLKDKAYGEMGSATKEAQKALARGIKEELETQFPEIKGLNAQEGKFINLDGALDRALNRIDNRQMLGIGTPIAAGAGAAIGGAPGAGAMVVLKYILDKPEVKSKLAIALHKASRGQLTIPTAFARVAAYSNALGNAQPSDSQGQQPTSGNSQ